MRTPITDHPLFEAFIACTKRPNNVTPGRQVTIGISPKFGAKLKEAFGDIGLRPRMTLALEGDNLVVSLGNTGHKLREVYEQGVLNRFEVIFPSSTFPWLTDWPFVGRSLTKVRMREDAVLVELPGAVLRYLQREKMTVVAEPEVLPSPVTVRIYGAQACRDGAAKYGPYNWREKPISLMGYTGAMERHLLAIRDGEDLAMDSLCGHLGHIIATAGILLDARECGTLIDDRPEQKGPAPRLLETMKSQNAARDSGTTCPQQLRRLRQGDTLRCDRSPGHSGYCSTDGESWEQWIRPREES